MNSIKVLDVTLRDGGCVNNFDFGQDYMDKILFALEKSNVEFIELGYIDQDNGSEQERTQYINEQVIPQFFLKHKKSGITYVAMIDYGKFNIENLKPRTDEGIDGIRMAFHKKNWADVIGLGREIINKGYQFYVQPMLTLRYSDMELLQLIYAVNEQLPEVSGFYIVDSFGEMRGTDISRLMHLIDNNLNENISLGFHSHNNLQLSYSNAMELLNYNTNRELILDCSVMGMGKGAGNLNTELLLEHLNLYYNKKYKIAPLLELIDQVINVIHKEMYWGYAAEYYLSSINHCTPSYAAYFYNKHMLPIDQVAELLSLVPEEKRISFDKKFAEQLYVEYNSKETYDDTEEIEILKEQFGGEKVLIIAPGKSIQFEKEKINKILEEKILSISLNNFEFETDYILTTRNELFDKAVQLGRKVIAPSRINQRISKNVFIIDYHKWVIFGEKTHDSSGVMVMKLMEAVGASELLLAGFDGFSTNINNNYYNLSMRKPVTEEQAVSRNIFYTNLIADVAQSMNVKFITKSKYEMNL